MRIRGEKRLTCARWTVEEIHLLQANADAPRARLLELLPKRSWSAIRGALPRYGVARLNNLPCARTIRPTPLLQDLTDARLARRLPQKCIEAKVGSLLSYLEAGRRIPSFPVLQKWCDALGLELRALPKAQVQEKAA